jgi:hypothetical protein
MAMWEIALSGRVLRANRPLRRLSNSSLSLVNTILVIMLPLGDGWRCGPGSGG